MVRVNKTVIGAVSLMLAHLLHALDQADSGGSDTAVVSDSGISTSNKTTATEKDSIDQFLLKFATLTKRDRERKVRPLGRIVNGNEVWPEFSYPYMTFIRLDRISDDDFLCGGTLFHPSYVLTAAHCVDPGYVSRFTVHVHRHDKSLAPAEEAGQVLRLRSLLRHEEYDDTSPTGIPYNDVAVLRLRTSARGVTKYVRLATPRMQDPKYSIKLTVVGWGLTFNGGQNSDTLQQSTHIHSSQKCFSDPASGLKREQHICGLGEYGEDACTNDSGGPLLLITSANNHIQIGIVSTGAACGVFGIPGIYTRVAQHYDWIRGAMSLL